MCSKTRRPPELADKEQSKSSIVILDRNQWNALTVEIGKLVNAYERLLIRNQPQRSLTQRSASVPPYPTKRSVGLPPYPTKRSLGSTTLKFLGFKQEASPERSGTYYGLLCSYCGADRDARDEFCRVCGRSIYSQKQIVRPQRRTGSATSQT